MKVKRIRTLLLHCLTIVMLLFSADFFAQGHEAEAHRSHHEEQHEHFHQNHLAIFVGTTSFLKDDGSHFSIGLDYVRVFSPDSPWSLSMLGEVIFAEHTELVFAIPLIFSLGGSHFWLRSGPGVEIIKEVSHKEGMEKTKAKAKFLYRIGVGYDFEIGSISLTPSLDLDMVRDEPALVWGINIGKGF